MSDRLVALCLRAAAPPPERGGSATDEATRAVRETTQAVHRLLERVAADPAAAVTLALAPTVTVALADDDLVLLRDLEAHARIETCVTGATDAWLPGLGGVGQRAQVGAAAAEHRRRLLRQPLGLWPRDLALPHGLDAGLAAAGFRWALVPARALELGRPPATPATPVFFRSGLAAFGARPWRAAGWATAAAVAGRPALAVATAGVTEAAAALEWATAHAEPITPAAYLRRYPRNPLGTPAALAGADETARGPYAAPERTGMIRHLRQLEAAMAAATSRSRAFAPAPGLRRRALLAGAAGQVDGVRRRARARAGDDRHAAAHLLHHHVDDVPLLVGRERRRLARRAARHEPVDAARDLRLDVPPQRLVVHPPIPHGGNQCGDCPGEHARQTSRATARRQLRSRLEARGWSMQAETSSLGPQALNSSASTSSKRPPSRPSTALR